MKQKTVGLTLRAVILALALILVAGPALPPLDGVAYAQSAAPTLTAVVAPGGGSVSVSWTEVDDADSYELYKQPEGGSWSSAMSMTGLAYNDTSVTAGTKYFYIVRAIDDGTAGAWSNTESVTIPGGTAAPTVKPTLTATADGLTGVDLSWTSVSGATSYDLRRWNSSTSFWDRIGGTLTGTSYDDDGRSSGATYFYVIRAVNSGGNGPWSSEGGAGYTQVVLDSPDAVPVLSHTHDSRQVVSLSWTATSSTATYNLERSRTVTVGGVVTAGDWEALALSATDQLARSHTDSNAVHALGTNETDPVIYSYRVQAVEGTTPGEYSNIEMVTIPASGVRPTPPTNLTAVAGSDAVSIIRLTWTATPGTTSEIRWKTSTRAYSDAMMASSPYNHTGRSPSTEYTYQVRAVNVNGPSLWSEEVSLPTAAAPATGGQMPKVRGLEVTDESSLDADNDAFVPKIKLEWDQVASATHYDIRRFPSGANVAEWGNPADSTAENNELTNGRIAVDDLLSPTAPSWLDEDSNISASTTYYYVVSAVNENGTGAEDDEMGEWSAYDGVTTIALSVGTDAPTGLDTTVTGPTSIWLSWTAVTNATSYTIQYRVGTGQYRTIADVTGTTYHHQGLTANTEYLYRIRAENANSMTSYSDPEISETTWRTGLQPPSNFMAEDDTTGNEVGEEQAFVIDVSWTAAAGAVGYQLQSWNPGTSAWEDVGTNTEGQGTTTDTSVDVAGLDAGTTYYFRVRTVTATATSAWSSTVSATTDPTKPVIGPALETTSTGMSMIRISWAEVTGATGYTLEAVEGIADAAADFATPLLTRNFTGSERHYVHTGLKAGTRYSYRLKAVLSDEVESPFGTPANEYTKPRKPELTASAVDHLSIRLSWDAVPFVTAGTPTAAGHLTNEGNYRIERRQTGTNTWTNVSLGTVDCTANKCFVVDDNGGNSLMPGTRYFYRIRAIGPIDSPNAVYTSYWDYASSYTQADPN